MRMQIQMVNQVVALLQPPQRSVCTFSSEQFCFSVEIDLCSQKSSQHLYKCTRTSPFVAQSAWPLYILDNICTAKHWVWRPKGQKRSSCRLQIKSCKMLCKLSFKWSFQQYLNIRVTCHFKAKHFSRKYCLHDIQLISMTLCEFPQMFL